MTLGIEREGMRAAQPAVLGPGDQGCKDLQRPNFVAVSFSVTLQAKGPEGPWGPHPQGQNAPQGHKQSTLSPPTPCLDYRLPASHFPILSRSRTPLSCLHCLLKDTDSH